MLACLLCNLPGFTDRDAGGYTHTEADFPRKKKLNAAIAEASKLIDAKAEEPLKAIKPRLEELATKDLPVDEFADLLRELSMREFELRRSLFESKQQDTYSVLILEQLTIILTIMREDEEAILLLLLG